MTYHPKDLVKFSLTLPGEVHAALEAEAKKEKREVNQHIQRILGEHTIASGFLNEDTAKRLNQFWWLVERAVEKAVGIRQRDGLTSDITLKTFQTCEADSEWLKEYENYIGGEARAIGNPHKGPINREIGFRIRLALEATVQKVDGGKKSALVKVKGAIIQSYSPFEIDEA